MLRKLLFIATILFLLAFAYAFRRGNTDDLVALFIPNPLPFAFSTIDPRSFIALNSKKQPVHLGEFPSSDDIRFVRYLDKELPIQNPVEQLRLVKKCLGLQDDEFLLTLPIGKDLNCNLFRWEALDLQNGKIFIWGGTLCPVDLSKSVSERVPLNPMDRTWVYDIQTRLAIDGPRMAIVSRQPNLLKLRDGRVLIIGGWQASSDKNLSDVQIFDPINNSIQSELVMCRPRHNHTSVELGDGTILVASGDATEGFENTGDGLTATAEIINLKLKKSTLIGRMHESRREGLAVAYGKTQAILFGGSTYTYDLSQDPISASSAELLDERR